jgi:hypothetical protein
MSYDAWQLQKVTKVFTIIATIGWRPLASARRPPCEGKSRVRAETLAGVVEANRQADIYAGRILKGEKLGG